jgi:integrative and conjugative element protein (TIGR02256 family)
MVISWITLYPSWYIQERQDIAYHYPSFSVYEKAFEAGTLIYFGELVVRASSGAIRHPVILEYPPGFPFQSPKVTPINSLPEISPNGEIRHKVTTIFLDKRHQMPDGSLCLFQRETRQIPGGDILRGLDVLRRAQQWFLGLHTRHWPPDSIQSELEAHFFYVTDVLLSKVFFSSNLKGSGRFFMIPDPRRVRDSEKPDDVSPMIVTAITEESGILKVLDAREDLSRVYPWIQDEAWGPSVTAKIETDKIDDLTEFVKYGYWWSLPEEPLPFRDGKGFLRELSRISSESDSWSIVSAALGVGLTQDKAHFFGIQYLGRNGETEWLILIMLRGERKDRLVLKTDEIKRREFEESPIYCLRVHTVREKYLRFRNTGVIQDSVKNMKVALIGLGALGSSVAELLAKAGIGKFRLCDMERLSTGNVARHIGGINEFGMRKTHVVIRRLLEINPFLTFEQEDILYGSAIGSLDRLSAFIKPVDLVISTVADEGVESIINQISVIDRKVVVYGRSLRSGSMGRVFLVRPGIDACKSCLSEYHNTDIGGNEVPEDWITIEERPEDVLLHECGRPVIAGSAIDLSFVSGLIARVALDYLEGKAGENNHWIWSRVSALEIDERLNFPLCTFSGTLKPNPNCDSCQEPEITRLVLTEEAKKMIISTTEASSDKETGGVLIGFVDNSRRAIVVKATGPGPNAVQTKALFDRDVEYIQTELEKAASELGERGLYLGEWHSHLEPDPRPSTTDITSLFGIAEALNYLTRSPSMIIVGMSPTDKKVCSVKSWNFMIGGRSYMLDIETLTLDEIMKLKIKK